MNSKCVRTFLISLIFLIERACSHVGKHGRHTGLETVNRQIEINSIASKFFFAPHQTNRIFGGRYAHDGQFPFMAIVHRLMPGEVIGQCGGTVISKRWVLTAAHCISEQPRKFFVVFGVVDKLGIGYDYNYGPGVSMVTSHAVVHPEYHHATNDIGLLCMPQDVPYTKKIQPIRLAGSYAAGDAFVDLNGYAVGWGKDRAAGAGTKALKYATLPIIGNDECSQFWQVDETNICTANDLRQNACQGDSGGPLLIMRNDEPLQVGIVSYGDGGCPSERPAVFTRVASFTRWIQNATGIHY